MEPKTGGLLKTELQSSITKLEEVWEGHLARQMGRISQFSLRFPRKKWSGTSPRMMGMGVKWFQESNRMSSWIGVPSSQETIWIHLALEPLLVNKDHPCGSRNLWLFTRKGHVTITFVRLCYEKSPLSMVLR